MLSATIRPEQDGGTIVMAEETRRKLRAGGVLTLHFGQFHKEMVIAQDKLAAGEVHIPARLSGEFTVPDLPYELRLVGSALHLGPVIGFMNYRRIYSEPYLTSFRFTEYNRIKGLVLIFIKQDVDRSHRLIRGKYYDPGTGSFRETVIPYPEVLYLRANPSQELYQHLKKHLGAINIFNYPFRSNKREFWRLASRDNLVKQHLPETCSFSSVREAVKMLDRFNAVYLKPSTWSKGRGIYYLSREGRKFCLADTRGETWQGSPSGLAGLLERLLTGREYLVQQAIPSWHQRRKIDFRIYLLKDQNMCWQFHWLETKVSLPGSIISNWSNQETLFSGEEGLMRFFGLDQEAGGRKIKEMTRICQRALLAMERGGHSLGDVALDLVLDNNLKVWLLEAQPDYSADISIRGYMLEVIHPHTLDYAKALTLV